MILWLHILMSLNLAEMTPLDLQTHMMQTIRQEFEHNISQQIYVSDEVWAMIENAKNQTIAFVNTIAQQMPADSNTLDFAKTLITAYRTNGDTPNDIALQALKNEAKTLL